jgi:glutamyl-tRNA(Gln) amidotransferase subunit D
MPRYESADKNYIVMKLKNGYNVGIKISNIQFINKIGSHIGEDTTSVQSLNNTIKGERHKYEYGNEVSKVALISTGGTIASKVDYRTGGVTAALSAAEIYASVPELSKVASLDPEVLLNEYSENLKPEHWSMIANKVSEKVKSGIYRGIVISHGTDTMNYTASALSFALQNLPIPVVLVGAQRSSDRPSSDAALNLLGATVFATKSEFSGVFIAMHADSSDDLIACHIGTRVRKNHTSKRGAFQSIDVMPVALVNGDSVNMQLQRPALRLQNRTNNTARFVAKPNFDKRAVLLKYHPGFDPTLISHVRLAGYKIIVLEGTGLGHVGRESFQEIQKAIVSGTMVFMTSQCIWGEVRMTVYDTGRDLLEIGVIPLSDMLPETAIAKAMWVIANSSTVEDRKKLMQQNIANEMSNHVPYP